MPVMIKPDIWQTWVGRSIAGRFPLQQWLGGSEHSAVFLSERPGQTPSKLAIKLIELDMGNAERQLSQLRATMQLSHPHLIRVSEAGRTQIHDTPVAYVVMDYAEEDLSQILPQRALGPEEVSDLLPSLLEALSYLHGKGLVHGRIKPSNVHAAGDQLKLSSDQVFSAKDSNSPRPRRDIYDAPEAASEGASAASDIWSLGVLVVEALTQKTSIAEELAAGKPGASDSLPQPFRGIVRECLQRDPKRRCSLSEIQSRLQPPARTVPAPPEPVSEAPAKTNRGSALAIALALLVVISLGYVFVHSRGKNSTASAPETTAVPSGETPAPPPPSRAPAASGSANSTIPRVTRQVMPDVPKSAQNTIRGTIKIVVQVQVDGSGKVTAAKFRMRGSSPYFSERALKAAEQWEFSPVVVNGQPASSTWLILFRLKRGSMQASAQELSR